MKFDIMTLFPDLVTGILSESIIGRAQAAEKIEVRAHNIRDFSKKPTRRVDDTPYGGGMGMVMECEPIYDCYRSVIASADEAEKRRVIYLSPKGRVFTQKKAEELASYDRLIFLCGHYEGVDERILDEIVDEEISIGDYVLTGGEVPACVIVDAVSRLLPGVLSAPECYLGESIASGLLEYPQYTRPPVFHGREVPPVLLSGHHKKIEEWRYAESLRLTRERRPDLLPEALLHPAPPEESRKKRRSQKKAEPPSAETDDPEAVPV